MASYEEVLHLLRYRNWHTRSLLDRKFKLICSELNGRYLSNEFKVEVSPGPPRFQTFMVATLQAQTRGGFVHTVVSPRGRHAGLENSRESVYSLGGTWLFLGFCM